MGTPHISRLAKFFFALVFIVVTNGPVHQLAGQSGHASGFQNVRVRMVNGSSIRATIESIDALGKVGGSELINGVMLSEIISIDTGRKSRESDDLPYVVLQSGGRQPFTQLTLDREIVEITTEKSVSRELPLALIQSIVFASSETVTRTQANRSRENDFVVVATSSGEQTVPGLVERIELTHVVVNYSGESRRIALDKIRAIVMAKLDFAQPVGTNATLDLTDGSRYAGVINSLSDQRLEVSLSNSFRMEFESTEIEKILIHSDRLVYLSDLSPIRQDEQTQYAAARPWQRDKSLLGNPLQLKFTSSNATLKFDKGIGTRSYTQIVFPNEGFDFFQAVVGIDVETNGHGDCEMVVSGDGIRLWSSRVKASDDPQKIKVDVTGIKEVELTVFPGEMFDLADHANWADARFIKN